MGLLRMAARTAVVAGTATAVSGRVAQRQANKYNEQQAQQAQQQAAQQPAYQQPAAPAPAVAEPPKDEATMQLENLAELHSKGILTDAEFTSAKAKILGI